MTEEDPPWSWAAPVMTRASDNDLQEVITEMLLSRARFAVEHDRPLPGRLADLLMAATDERARRRAAERDAWNSWARGRTVGPAVRDE